MRKTRPALRVYYFTLFASLGVQMPFLPPWLEAQGFVGLKLGLMTALMPLMSILAPPALGFVADLFGLRGSLLRWASALSAGCFLVLGLLALGPNAVPFWLAFGCFATYALCRSPLGSMADVIALEEGTDYGRLRVWGTLGFMASAAAAGLWIREPNSAWVPLSIFGFLVTAHIASHALPRKTRLPPGPVLNDTRELLAERTFRLFLLSAFFGMGAQTAYDLCSSLHWRDHGASPWVIGLGWASGAGSEVLMMVYSGHLLRRFSPVHLRSIAFLTAALRWLLMATFDSLPALLALQPLHAITFGLMWVSSIEIVKTTARPSNLASAQGLFVGTASLGGALGLTAWGTLYDAAGGSAVFYAASALSLAALGCNALFGLFLTRPALSVGGAALPAADSE